MHHLEKADVILSLESDFLAWGPARLKDARAFAARREPRTEGRRASMNRLYVVESTPSLTGAAADHRLAITSRDVGRLASALADAIEPGERGRAGRWRPSRPARRRIPAGSRPSCAI